MVDFSKSEQILVSRPGNNRKADIIAAYLDASTDQSYMLDQLQLAEGRAKVKAALDAQYGAPTPNRAPSTGKLRITFEVYEEFAPALRSAIEEISENIGGRLTGSHRFAKEQALTDAAIALAPLRVALTAKIPAGDPNYV